MTKHIRVSHRTSVKMAQALFEALAAGVQGMDSQTALAVQSLLETQTVAETSTQVDEDDMFQCGKCKKQFNSLSAFVNHKQSRCEPTATRNHGNQTQTSVASPSNVYPSSSVQQVLSRQIPTYTPVPSSPLTQIGQSMVLTDDLMTFSIDQNALQSSTLQMGTTTQGNPFLSQVAPLTPRSTNCPTNFSTISTQAFSTNSVFTGAIPTNQITLQQVSPPQPAVSSGPGAEITPTITIASKNSPSKNGKKAAITPSNPVITVATSDLTTSEVIGTVLKKRKGQTISGMGMDTAEVSAKKKLKCQYCDKMFSKNFDLQQHVRSHTGEKPFQCIVCGRAFAQKSNVKKHMQTHKVWPTGGRATLPRQPEPEVIVVQQEVRPADIHPVLIQENTNNDEVNVDAELEVERRVNIIIDNSYMCQYCNIKFKSYFELKSHMTQHKSEQVYRCIMKTCGASFQELDSFLEHTKTHENDMSYRCHLCNKHFSSLYDLGVHQYSHSLYPNQGPKPGPRYFRCTKCMNKYATPEALEHHMQTTTHKYPCPHCEKMFACERYLRRHLPTHGTVGEHVCEICNKRFKTEHYLKMHALIHSGEKPFRCEQCEAAFNRKDKLKRHLLIHEPVKKYKCPFRTHTGCTKEFNRPDKLKAHIISHSGIKPYKCRECGKAFSRRPHLIEHERGHRNDFLCRCDLCGKGFFRLKLLQEHKTRCTGAPEKNEERPVIYKRRNKRKVGRPRKRIITVTEEAMRQNAAEKKVPGRRGRPRKIPLIEEPQQAEKNGMDVLVSQEVVMIEAAAVTDSATHSLDKTNTDHSLVTPTDHLVNPADHMVKLNLISGQLHESVDTNMQLQATADANMQLHASGDANMQIHGAGNTDMVPNETQTMVHHDTNNPHNADSISSTVQAVFTGPGATCAVVGGPHTLLSGPTTCMVMTADSSGNLVATQQTAQLVTADGATHLVTTGDGGGQTYVTAGHINMGYSTGDTEAVLHGAENLLTTSGDILTSVDQ